MAYKADVGAILLYYSVPSWNISQGYLCISY